MSLLRAGRNKWLALLGSSPVSHEDECVLAVTVVLGDSPAVSEPVATVQRLCASVARADLEFHRSDAAGVEHAEGAFEQARPDALAAPTLADGDVLDVSERTAVVGHRVRDDVPDDAPVLGDQKPRLAEVLFERTERPGLGEGGLLDAVDREQVRTLGLSDARAPARFDNCCHASR
jgi:hypothetical protein